jgi:para-nitrobenzyl esterase
VRKREDFAAFPPKITIIDYVIVFMDRGTKGEVLMRKKTIVFLVALCLVATAAFLVVGCGEEETTRAETTMEVPQLDSGPISGLQEDGIWTYLGIPFAAPPVGELRWKEPQPVAAWDDVRPCTEFGPSCPQPPWSYDFAQEEMAVGEQSEDCLYLNVWTPAESPDEKLPVMVWLHGGAFLIGSGSQILYNGQNLAEKGVVVVTVNYRINVLGFLAHPLLSEESPNSVSGNYGLLDQIAALQWVERNIAAFGGDADLVTVFGQSAGGASICDLMVSPLAEGLFDRAIVQSGGFFSMGIPVEEEGDTLKLAERQGVKISEELGCDKEEDELACLRGKTPEELMDALNATSEGALGFASIGPNIDGYVIPENPPVMFAAGEQASVPLLIGTNANEGAYFAPDLTLEQYRMFASFIYGAYGDEVLALYPAQTEEEIKPAFAMLLTEMLFAAPSKFAAASMADVDAPAYLYKFTQMPKDPLLESMGAYHGYEVAFVFGNERDGAGEDDAALSEAMMTYWTNFAATGDPNGAGEPEWPEYTLQTDEYQVLGTPISTESGYYPEAYDIVIAVNEL